MFRTIFYDSRRSFSDLFCRKNFNPVIIRIVDEIKSHLLVLEADATHFLVELTHFLVITVYTQAEMTLVFTQFIRFGMITQPVSSSINPLQPSVI